MFSLESAIPMDSFVDTINPKSFGFAHVECKGEGRPPYHPAVILSLIYTVTGLEYDQPVSLCGRPIIFRQAFFTLLENLKLESLALNLIRS